MTRVFLLLLLVFALTFAAPQEKGLLLNLDNGELCFNSFQCKSGCCFRNKGSVFARCAPKSPESQKCSPMSFLGVYKACPCESGLTCVADKTIVGSITNSDFGVCKDQNNRVQ